MNRLAWVDDALNLLAPRRCLACGTTLDARHAVCAPCRDELPWNACACPTCAEPAALAAPCGDCLRGPPAFDAAWAPFLRRDVLRRGVARLKYHADFPQLQVLSQLMAEALLARPGPRPDLLIPVPLPRRRLLARGYNQALEIARRVGGLAGIAVDADAARLLRTPRDQIGQTAAQRRRNLRGAFEVDARVAGRHVALLDDVMTTGATLDALARAARKAGATRIEAWALAREPRVGPAT